MTMGLNGVSSFMLSFQVVVFETKKPAQHIGDSGFGLILRRGDEELLILQGTGRADGLAGFGFPAHQAFARRLPLTSEFRPVHPLTGDEVQPLPGDEQEVGPAAIAVNDNPVIRPRIRGLHADHDRATVINGMANIVEGEVRLP
jgi:hypothetical protein